ncbi:MAG: hypothetical protein ACLQDQ_18450 [Myxococcaceae bacterium]
MPAEGPAAAPGPVDDIPPPLGTWRRLYAVVLGVLVLEIVLLALLARAFG